MVRKAFIFFNSLSMIVFLLSTIVVLTEAFPLKEVEYEDNVLMLTNAAFVFLLALTSAANFYYFFKNLPPSGYLFIIPATLAGLSLSVAVLALLAGSVDFLFAIIAAVISMVPLANVFLLKKLGLVQAESTGDNSSIEASSYIPAGTKLIREWNGRTIEVLVTDQGFEHAGRHYRSLSQIARHITGAHWSGPRFFGLVKRTQYKTA